MKWKYEKVFSDDKPFLEEDLQVIFRDKSQKSNSSIIYS